MRNNWFIVLGTCLAVLGCQKNEVVSGPSEVILTASSSQASPESKVSIDEEIGSTTAWSENDEISVFTSENAFKTFTLASGAGEKTGTFSATLGAGETVSDYAIYPAGNHSYSDGNLKVNLPATYAFVQGVSNIPMISTVDESHILNFKHCGGVIRFGVRNITVKGTFVFTCRTHRVTGDFDVAFADGVPTITAEEDNAGSVVTISFDKPETPENLYYFYVPVPTGSYTDFTIEVKNEDGTVVMTKSAANNKNVVRRGTVLKMKTIVQPEFTGGNEGTN